ncbi:molecular chaperone GrpE [Humitalea rosea]|uniref:Protein GrpE n=1 Tax=Humitalea rosea TaxID=990373 RepID=A0A2W7IS09_9PROT|nr:nucleotide exchange factor GrpE [Humitalea rosea]PZW50391.1 molecular chaperone GrpE [Humitalea rosea]
MTHNESNPTHDQVPEGAASAEHTALIETPEQRIATLEAEVATMKDRWLRAEAETANVRARATKDIQDARAYAVQKFASDVAEAAENLARGLAALPAEAPGEPELLQKMRGGFSGIEKAFIAMLERHGVKREDATGKPFDPALHQAMAEQPAPPGVAPGTVIHAYSAAWSLHGRLLRPAMVVVAAQPGQ